MDKIALRHKTKLVSPFSLNYNPQNAAKHPLDQVLSLAAAFKKFGFIGAVVVGSDNVVLAGEGRVRAARKAGMTEIPVIDVAHLSRKIQRAYAVSENKLSEMKTWDDDMLQREVEAICEEGFSLVELGLSSIDEILEDPRWREHEERTDGEISDDEDFDTDKRRDREIRESEEYDVAEGSVPRLDQGCCPACGQRIVDAA